MLHRLIVALLVALAVSVPVAGQETAKRPEPGLSAAMPVEQAAAVTSGWALIAEGKYAEASSYAEGLIARYPRNVAVLDLAVEAALARQGATAGLDAYERWLGGRTLEEPGVLRRIARAVLYQWAGQTDDPHARIEALKALTAEGDAIASDALVGSALDGNLSDIRALATIGNRQAVDRIVTRMLGHSGPKLEDIETLADTGSSEAVAALTKLLDDPLPENRAGAARALGRIGDGSAATALRVRLGDPHGLVRLEVAGALLKLGDSTGIGLLRELAASSETSARRSAAWLLSSRPDAEWQGLVRSLANDSDPAVRLDAAKLLAPHDPAFARMLFEQLSHDPNPAIRDAVSVAEAAAPVTGLSELRSLMRTGNARAKVAAADRILKVTR